MHRARAGPALGCGNRERAVRTRRRATQPRRAPARRQRPLAAAPLRPRRRRPHGGPAVDASAVFGRDRRRDGVGAGRARHEVGRGNDDHGVPARESRGPRASRRRRASRALRRGGRGRFRREVPRAGASRSARRRSPCARRGRRGLPPRRRPPLLPDPGGREADVHHQGDRTRARGSRRTTVPRRGDGATGSDAARARPQAHSSSRDCDGQSGDRGDGRSLTRAEGRRAPGPARHAHTRSRASPHRRAGTRARRHAAQHRERDHRPRRLGGERHPVGDRGGAGRPPAAGLRPRRPAGRAAGHHRARHRARGAALRRGAGRPGHGVLRRAGGGDP